MAQLTSDEKNNLIGSITGRITQILREKALYWQEFATPNRSDVNKRTQKRKKFSKQIFGGSFTSGTNVSLIAAYWLTTYDQDVATQGSDGEGSYDRLDVDGVPTSREISNTFDPTYDYWADVQTGDDTDVEIEW